MNRRTLLHDMITGRLGECEIDCVWHPFLFERKDFGYNQNPSSVTFLTLADGRLFWIGLKGCLTVSLLEREQQEAAGDRSCD